MMWFSKMMFNSVEFDPAAVRFCCAAAKASSVGANIVTPCSVLIGFNSPALLKAELKVVRLLAVIAAVNSPGKSIIASMILRVTFPTVVVFKTSTMVLNTVLNNHVSFTAQKQLTSDSRYVLCYQYSPRRRPDFCVLRGIPSLNHLGGFSQWSYWDNSE